MNATRRITGRVKRRWPDDGALRADQPALLVEAQGGGRHAAAGGQLADRQQLGHDIDRTTESRLTSSALEVASYAA